MSEESTEQTVPLSRFKELNDKYKALKVEHANIQEQLETVSKEAQGAERYKTQLEQARADLEQANAKYDTHSTIAKYGIVDPDVRDGIEFAFGRLDEATQKDGLDAWLKTCTEDPGNAPTLLRPHFQGLAPAQEAESQPEAKSETSKTPPSNPLKGQVPDPLPPQAEMTPAEIMSMPRDQYAKIVNARRAEKGLPPVGE